jgi:hypothetical protein
MSKLLLASMAAFAVGLPRGAGAEETLLIRLPTEVATARSVGLGGALVGLGGDASSFVANPASLIAVPRSLDAVAGGGNHGAYGFGFALHPYRTLALGLLLPTTDRRMELVSPTLDGARLLRPVDGRWGALGLAWTPLDRRLSVGASAEVAHLRIVDGSDGKSARQHWVNASFGIYVQPDGPDGTRLGVAYRIGADRTFGVEAGTFGAAAAGAQYRVRRPDVLSVGASWRYGWLRNTHVTFTVQPDVVLYGKVLGSEAGNELDVRAAMEVSLPRGDCVSGCGGMWQLRAGLVSRSAIPTLVPTLGDGYDPGRRSTVLVAGGSFTDERLLSGKIRFDVGYTRSCDSQGEHCNTVVAGISYRFPTAFRGDLQHHRVPR